MSDYYQQYVSVICGITSDIPNISFMDNIQNKLFTLYFAINPNIDLLLFLESLMIEWPDSKDNHVCELVNQTLKDFSVWIHFGNKSKQIYAYFPI